MGCEAEPESDEDAYEGEGAAIQVRPPAPNIQQEWLTSPLVPSRESMIS